MPKQLAKNIGRNYAEKITGAAVESIFNAETSRDHGLNAAQAALSIGADNLLIVGEYLATNPKVAGVFGHALKYGYVDAAIGICRDILDKKSSGEITYNVGKNVAVGVAQTMIGGAVATGAESVMIGVGVEAFLNGAMWGARLGMMAGPVGAAIGIGVGALAGVAIGKAVQYVQNKYYEYKNSSSSYQNEANRQSSMSKPDNSANVGYFSFGSGGPGGSGGSGGGLGGGGGGFSFGSSPAGGAESYLASILGGGPSKDVSQYFNRADSKSLESMLNSINNSGGTSGLGEFAAQLSLQGLVNSFNSYNGGEMAFGLGALVGDIGGVATQAGEVKGLRNSRHHFENEFMICLKSATAQKPYSNEELSQLMVQLAIGVFVQKTVPFFSLHFNEDGSLYPVIHPAYQKTLVGEVISYLDYYMKGFLNGGMFPQAFLEKWDVTMNTSREHLKANLIDLKAYAKQHGIKYHSLREMMAEQGLQSADIQKPEDNTVHGTKFRTSFRIISKLRKVEQESNMFIIDADFDVEYTIDLMPDYKEYLSSYQIQKGKMPEDYMKIQVIYKNMADQIKRIMPTLPFCQKYFEMLKVITFLTSYFKTLREMMKIPILDQINLPRNKIPKAFPPIPVRYYSFHKLTITVEDVLKQIQQQSIKCKEPNLLDSELLRVFQQGKNNFEQKLKDIITKSMETLLKKALGNNFQNQLDINYMTGLAQLFNLSMVRFALTKQANFIKQIEEINKHFLKDPQYQKIDIEVINSKPTLSLKIEYFIQMIQRNQAVRLKNNQIELKKNYQSSLKQYNEQFKTVTTDFEASKIKQLKQFEKNLNKQADEAEVNRKQQMKTFKTNIRSQGDTLIANQLAKIPYYQQATYNTQIQEMKNDIESQITTQINQKETQSKQNLQNRIEEARVNGKNAIKQDQRNRENRLQAEFTRIKSELQATYKQQVRELPATCKRQTEETIKKIKEMENQLRALSKQLLAIKELCKMNLATKAYLNSQITIADKGYYKDVGDNFRIIGGCGVKLPEVVPGTVRFGKEVLAQVSNTLMKNQKNTIYMQKIGNENMLTFKSICSDNRFSYDFLQMLNFYKARDNQLRELEFKLILLLLQKLPIQGIISNKDFNIKRVNKRGLTLGHISAVTAMQKQNLGLLYNKDNRIFDTVDDFGNYPIHTAAIHAPVCNTQYLLSINKENLERKNDKGLTPLLCAVIAGNLESVDLLLKMGANVNHKLPNCLNALFLALERGDEQICMRLLSVSGINVNAIMPSGDTALHMAIRLNLVRVAKKIIPLFQNFVQARTKSKGFNPLHEAAYYKNVSIVEELLKTAKIPIDTKTDAGDTALHLAAEVGCIQIAKILIAYKANPNEENKRKQIPLNRAIRNNNQQLALILVRVSQVNKVDGAGKTCSLLACENLLFEVADGLFKEERISTLRTLQQIRAEIN